MNFCPKCHKKMKLGEGNVFVKLGDAELKTVAAIYSCGQCNQHTTNFQFRVEPIQVVAHNKQEESTTGTETEKREFNA